MTKKWKKIEEKILDDNSYWKYKKDIFEFEDKKQDEYFYGEINDGVLMVPVLDDGRLVLVRQHRYLRDQTSLEFPKGRLFDSETPQVGAMRELQEETGFTSSNFLKAGSFDSLNSHFKQTMHVFVADELSQVKGGQNLDLMEEGLEVVIRRIDEFEETIRRGEIWDGHTLAAWSLARERILAKSYVK